MKKLNIVYVFRRKPRSAEDLPYDLVEVYIGVSRSGVKIGIVRRGFVVADHVMQAIEDRIQQLATTDGEAKPLAERIGLYPAVNDDWRHFFEELLQRDDSWEFLVPTAGACSAS